MKYCKKCKRKIPDKADFCPVCGEMIKEYGAEEEAEAITEKNFGTGVAAVICTCFPIASIIAIILGARVINQCKKVRALAIENGFALTGKYYANRATGLIAIIAGIIMTIIWAIISVYNINIILEIYMYGFEKYPS